MNGYIALHRELIDKAIWTSSKPIQKVILITILTMANHKANEWEWNGKKFNVNPGQFITSLDSLAKKCGKEATIQVVRTALTKFEKYEFIKNESKSTGRLITIVNWDLYQNPKNPQKQDNQRKDRYREFDKSMYD